MASPATEEKHGDVAKPGVLSEVSRPPSVHNKGSSKEESDKVGLDNFYCVACAEHSSKSAIDEPKLVTPTPKDILMGRGRPYLSHPGNMVMRRLVERNKARYNQAHRDSRGSIANELLDQIHESGARFLKRRVGKSPRAATAEEIANKTWEEATRSEAYEKVCHALRSRDKPSKASRRKNKLPSQAERQENNAEDVSVEAKENSTRVSDNTNTVQPCTTRSSENSDIAGTLARGPHSSFNPTHQTPLTLYPSVFANNGLIQAPAVNMLGVPQNISPWLIAPNPAAALNMSQFLNERLRFLQFQNAFPTNNCRTVFNYNTIAPQFYADPSTLLVQNGLPSSFQPR